MDCVEFNHSNTNTKGLGVMAQLDGSNPDLALAISAIRNAFKAGYLYINLISFF